MRKRKSRLAKSVTIARQQAQYDAAVKRILSDKNVLARILKGCVDTFSEYETEYIRDYCIEAMPRVSEVAVDMDVEPDFGVNRPESINGMRNESNSINEGDVRYDIIFSARLPDTRKKICVIINVEAQKSMNVGYPLLKRVQYYLGRLTSAQKNTIFKNSEYDKLQKVYSVWIVMNAGMRRRNTITEFRMTERNLVGRCSWKKEHYDLQAGIIVCLGDYNETDNELLKMLDVLLAKDIRADEKQRLLEDEMGLPMTEEFDEEVNEMCNLGEGIYEQGIEQGVSTGERNVLSKLIASGKYTLEDIAQDSGVELSTVMEIARTTQGVSEGK